MTIIAGAPIKTETNCGNVFGNCRIWFAQNGRTRTRLALYAAQGVHIECVDVKVITPVYVAHAVPAWTGRDCSREASVYLHPDPGATDELYAVWLNTYCGFSVFPKDAVLWQASSVGRPKKSASQIAVVNPGCYIERYSYKFAQPSYWYAITLDGAVRSLGEQSNIIALASRGDKDAARLAELKGWLSGLTGQLEVQDEL
jgi:hypothetical protein